MQPLKQHLESSFPGRTQFDRQTIINAAKTLHLDEKEAYKLLQSMVRVTRGVYSFRGVAQSVTPPPTNIMKPIQRQESTVPATPVDLGKRVMSSINDDVYVPAVDPAFVPWGDYGKIKQIIASGIFFPTFISGVSGNGKTIMVEQACASLGREYIRVQISPETDEDDLIGGFRLVNGETVFQKGPVIKAMQAGAVLLIDEIDRSSNKIMCLQGVTEGTPIMIKKTGEVIIPQPGFTVIATGNTKGRGSDDGRYSSAIILDDAFLERFVVTINHPFPSQAIEEKIVIKQMEKFGCLDTLISQKLSTWSEIIRKTFLSEGVDDFISTRRLVHIVKTFSIFRNEETAIALCISRFNDDTQAAFKDLYTKITPTVGVTPSQPTIDDSQAAF